ncbi:MAG TPA: hypothetical protein VKT71_12545 [Candidatus Acidoferrales bacterium]|nr:hypothetical protein [Candidatus Acidoferrales bacterium]
MDRYIIKWSHRLGVLALGLAFFVRAVDIVDPRFSLIPTGGDNIGYLAFVHAAVLLFLTTIATTCYTWASQQESKAESKVREPKADGAGSKSMSEEIA